MDFGKINNENCQELSILKTSNINQEIFEQIIDKIIFAFEKIGIYTEDRSIYYERHNNGSSILAIQISKGNNLDLSNYMINASVVEYYNNKARCDVYLHANKKIAKQSTMVSNLISKDIVNFFDLLEQELLTKGLKDTEILIRIPLSNQNEKKTFQTVNKIKSNIRRLFKK